MVLPSGRRDGPYMASPCFDAITSSGVPPSAGTRLIPSGCAKRICPSRPHDAPNGLVAGPIVTGAPPPIEIFCKAVAAFDQKASHSPSGEKNGEVVATSVPGMRREVSVSIARRYTPSTVLY